MGEGFGLLCFARMDLAVSGQRAQGLKRLGAVGTLVANLVVAGSGNVCGATGHIAGAVAVGVRHRGSSDSTA